MQEASGQLEGLTSQQSAQGRALLAEMQEKLAQACACPARLSASGLAICRRPRLPAEHVWHTVFCTCSSVTQDVRKVIKAALLLR